MEGFFSKKETASLSRPDGKAHSCVSCGLYNDCKNPRMKPYGNFKKKILIIGEAPGELDDKYGIPWEGKTGGILKRKLESLGVDLFEDCLSTNACLCRPVTKDGDSRLPSNYEVECCRRTVLKTIIDNKPQIVLLLGNAAVYSVIGHRWKKDMGSKNKQGIVEKWRGWTIPDQDLQTWICPTFHPSYIERSKDGPENVIWTADLKNALQYLKIPFRRHIVPEIKMIEDLSVLNTIRSEFAAFDYETTGKKPHAKGHRIVCVSIAVSENLVYVFMLPDTRQERKPFIDFLLNPDIKKIAQNMKYEHTWSLVRLRWTVVNWFWDTMLASHVLDNRQGTTGLKFQVYVQFGIVDYSSELDPYLHTEDKEGSNVLNKIFTLLDKPGGRKKLLTYCAYDSIYEYRLAMLQMKLMIK